MTDRAPTTLRQRIEGWGSFLRSNPGIVIGAIVIGVFAVLIVWVSTNFGAAMGTDSIVYLAAARNLQAGDGISWIGPQGDVRPLAIFAPLYPVVLAGISSLTGLDVSLAARWLLSLVFCINVVLLIVLVYKYSRQTWLALAAGVLFLFSRPMIDIHSMVASEALFLTFLLTSVLLISRFKVSSNTSVLIWSGIFMGLAFLTRYAGVYFIAGGALAIFLSNRKGWKERIKVTLIWSGINLVFVLGWVLRNNLVAGSGTARTWMPMLPPKELLEHSLSVVAFWFMPEIGPLWMRVLLVSLLSVGILLVRWLWLKRSQKDGEKLRRHPRGMNPSLLLLLISIYVIGLFLTRSLVVPRIDIIARTLFPAHVLVLLLMLIVLADWFDLARIRSTSQWLARAILAVTVVFVFVYVLRGLELIQNLREDGQGYASEQWRESPLINAMNLLPDDTPIYTNHVEAIYFYTGRHPYRLPYGCLPEDVLVEEYAQADCQEPAYLEWVQAMRQKLEEEQAVIVLFGRTYEQVYDPLIPDLINGLVPLSVQGDGTMYVHDLEEWPENPNW